jgi:hypothetical protein
MISSLSEEQKDFLYKLYLFLRKAPLSEHGRYRTFEAAASEVKPWYIDSISVAALEWLVTTGATKGLRRGHRVSRKTRATRMFDDPVSMGREEMLGFFYQNDLVTVVTAEENSKDGFGHWSATIPVPQERLKGGSFSISATKPDIAWAAREYANYLVGEVEKEGSMLR